MTLLEAHKKLRSKIINQADQFDGMLPMLQKIWDHDQCLVEDFYQSIYTRLHPQGRWPEVSELVGTSFGPLNFHSSLPKRSES